MFNINFNTKFKLLIYNYLNLFNTSSFVVMDL